MITSTIVLDLSRDQRESDNTAIKELYGIPDGSRVVLDVGDRWLAEPRVVEYVSQYVDSLHFDVHGSLRAVEEWTKALRRRWER